MKDFERDLLNSRILELEAEAGGFRETAEALAAEVLHLRERMDLMVEKARPVKREELDGWAGWLICLDDREWQFVRGGTS